MQAPDRKHLLGGRLYTRADPLLRAIVGVALALGALFAGLIYAWGPGPVLFELPWYIPATHSFVGLAAFSIAFLALGRYSVLRDPADYWIGTAFAAFGILSALFILTWPGLLGGGRGVLTELPNTSAWIAVLELSCMSLCLLAAVVAPWPGERHLAGRRWLASLAGWLAGVTLISCLCIAFERRLPPLIGPRGNLTPLLLGWDWVFMALFACEAVLSTRRYRRSGDRLIGYVALTQLMLAFVVLTALVGAKRYDLWAYLSRLLLIGGFLTMMFGLLTEYPRLIRRAREQSQALEARSAELATVLEAVPAVVWIAHDPAAQVITGNRAAAELLRMSPDQNLSKSAPGEEAPRHFQVYQQGRELEPAELPVQRAARGEAIYGFEEEIVFADGARATLLGNAIPLYGDDGRVRGAVAAFLDISARQQAEAERAAMLAREQAALAAAEQAMARLSRLQQVTAALVEALTPEQVGEVLVQHVVDALGAQTAALGLRADDARLSLVHTVGYPPDALAALQQVPLTPGTPLADCVQSGEAIYLESPAALRARYPALDEARAALGTGAWAAVPLRSQGRTLGGLRITFAAARPFGPEERALLLALSQQGAAALERARLYATERSARAEAEAAVRLREEFLAIASHELKTPLAVLLGSVQLLQRRLQGSELLSARDRGGLERILAQGRRLERMVSRLLDLGRIAQGRLQLEVGQVDLRAVVEQSIAEIQALSPQHTIVVLAPEGSVWLRGDELRLTQVLQNLVENAVKYSPRGRTITVSLAAEDHSATLAVADEGIGIPAGDLPHLWQRFYRAGNVNVDHISGVGIGLYVVQEIVALRLIRRRTYLGGRGSSGPGRPARVLLPGSDCSCSLPATSWASPPVLSRSAPWARAGYGLPTTVYKHRGTA